MFVCKVEPCTGRAGLYNFEKPSGRAEKLLGRAGQHTAREVGQLTHMQRFCGQRPSPSRPTSLFPPF